MPYVGSIVYECRYCKKDIEISTAIEEVKCPSCKKKYALLDDFQEYLKNTFID